MEEEKDTIEETPQEQHKNSKDGTERLRPYQFKKGQSGNPGGRPKGMSLKEWAKNYLASMTDEERLDYLEGHNKIDIWKMAEGVPDSKTEETGSLKVLLLDKELANIYGIRTTPETNGSSQEPNKIQGS